MSSTLPIFNMGDIIICRRGNIGGCVLFQAWCLFHEVALKENVSLCSDEQQCSQQEQIQLRHKRTIIFA